MSERTAESTRYSKLKVVSTFIENNGAVGTVDNPNGFFRGVMPMRWGSVGQKDGMVYFGGVTDQTIVGLGGSLKHVIGAIGTGNVENASNDFPSSTLASIYVSLSRAMRNVDRELATQDLLFGLSDSVSSSFNLEEGLQLIAYTTTRLNGLIQKFEFLAVRLQEGPYHMGRRQSGVLLGSPRYGAIAE